MSSSVKPEIRTFSNCPPKSFPMALCINADSMSESSLSTTLSKISKKGPGRPSKKKKNDDCQKAIHAHDFVKYILSLKTSTFSPEDIPFSHMRSMPMKEFEEKFKKDQMEIRLREKEEASRIKSAHSSVMHSHLSPHF